MAVAIQKSTDAAQPGADTNVFVYKQDAAADATGWLKFDPVETGATDISADFDAEYRMDLVMGPITAGQFRQKTGSAVVHFPNTEHSFLFRGKVEITDLDTGESAILGPGDGFIAKQGSRVLWKVLEPMHKSFFQYTE